MAKKRPSNTCSYTQSDKASFPVSVDTVDFELIGVRFRSPNKFTRYSKLHDSDGDLLKESSSLYRVAGYGGKNSAVLRSVKLALSDEVCTRVSVSAPKHLSGQNLWSPPSLKPLVGEVIARLFEKLRTYPDASALRKMDDVRPKHVRLHRVDLFCCYCLKHGDQVTSLIRQLNVFLSTRRRGQLHKFGARYLSWRARGRRGIEIVFYDKSQEVKRHQAAGKEEDVGGIELPDGILKIELRLYAEELKRCGLASLSRWKDDTAAKLFKRYVGEIVRSSSLAIPLMPVSRRTLAKLPARLRPPYTLAAFGMNLERVYSIQSVRRYDKVFAEHGIAISARGKTRSRKLSRILLNSRILSADQLPRNCLRNFEYRALRMLRPSVKT